MYTDLFMHLFCINNEMINPKTQLILLLKGLIASQNLYKFDT